MLNLFLTESNESPEKTTTPENQNSGIRERKASSVKRERKISSEMRDRTKSKTDDDLKTKQYEVEKMETGKVNMSVYYYYILNMGIWLFSFCVFAFTAYQILSAASNVWLTKWSDQNNNIILNCNESVPSIPRIPFNNANENTAGQII